MLLFCGGRAALALASRTPGSILARTASAALCQASSSPSPSSPVLQAALLRPIAPSVAVTPRRHYAKVPSRLEEYGEIQASRHFCVVGNVTIISPPSVKHLN